MATGASTLEREAAARGFFEGLRAPYKAGQAVVSRRIAFWTCMAFAGWAGFDLWKALQGFDAMGRPAADVIWGWFAAAGAERPAWVAFLARRMPLAGVHVSLSLLVGGGVGLGAAMFAAWYLKRPWLADLLIETEGELKKVSWPSWDDAWVATQVVTWTVAIFTLVLLVFDFGITKLLKLFFNLEI